MLGLRTAPHTPIITPWPGTKFGFMPCGLRISIRKPYIPGLPIPRKPPSRAAFFLCRRRPACRPPRDPCRESRPPAARSTPRTSPPSVRRIAALPTGSNPRPAARRTSAVCLKRRCSSPGARIQNFARMPRPPAPTRCGTPRFWICCPASRSRLPLVLLLHIGREIALVADDGIESKVRLEQQIEDLPANLRQIVLGVEGDSRLAILRLHRRHRLEVRVGQQFGPERLPFSRHFGRLVNLHLAENEVVRTAAFPDDDAPLSVEQCRIAGLVHEVVDRFLLGLAHRALTSPCRATQRPGPRPVRRLPAALPHQRRSGRWDQSPN